MPAATPTPVAPPPPAAASLPLLPDLGRALAESARLDLYGTNPFRALGLFPPADAAALVARVQAVLTGAVAPAWAFGPSLPLSPEQLHRAGEAADAAVARLLAELFWFWPETYPDCGADAALTSLAAGDAEAAYGRWLAAPGPTATHNMAVMFHYAALGRELEHGPLDDEARAWWSAAAEQWTTTLADSAFWERWSARLRALGLPATAVRDAEATVRQELPLLLARLSLLAAAERARRGELAEARWLREFAVRRLGDEASFAAVATAVLEGEQRRAEAVLAEAEERLTADDEPCLRHVVELFRQMTPRRRAFEAVAGPDSAALRRLGARVIEVGLAGLAEQTRRGGAPAGVLPWLMHLAGWPAAAEPRRAVAAALRTGWEQATGGGPGASGHEAVLRVCAETLVPAIEQFAWDERTQSAYRQRVAAQLRALAREACLDAGDFDVTSQACALAAEILDEEARPLMVRERRLLWQQFQRAHNGALRLEFNGSVLEIDARQLRFDQRTWPVATLNGLRFGVTQGLGGEGPQVAWYAGREALVLDAVTWFDAVDGGAERYRQIVEALDACVVPALAARLAERVQAGQSVVCGPSALRPDGFVFQRRPGQLVPEVAVPYRQLTQRSEGGELVVAAEAAAGASPAEARYSLGAVWNAVALPATLARLAEAD